MKTVGSIIRPQVYTREWGGGGGGLLRVLTSYRPMAHCEFHLSLVVSLTGPAAEGLGGLGSLIAASLGGVLVICLAVVVVAFIFKHGR